MDRFSVSRPLAGTKQNPQSCKVAEWMQHHQAWVLELDARHCGIHEDGAATIARTTQTKSLPVTFALAGDHMNTCQKRGCVKQNTGVFLFTWCFVLGSFKGEQKEHQQY